MTTDSIAHLLDAFDHLIEKLQEEDIDREVISLIEEAKETLIEAHADLFNDDDD